MYIPSTYFWGCPSSIRLSEDVHLQYIVLRLCILNTSFWGCTSSVHVLKMCIFNASFWGCTSSIHLFKDVHPQYTSLRMHLRWILRNLYLLACQVRVTVGDWGSVLCSRDVFAAVINSTFCLSILLNIDFYASFGRSNLHGFADSHLGTVKNQ